MNNRNHHTHSTDHTNDDAITINTLSSDLSSFGDLHVHVGSPSQQHYNIMADARNYETNYTSQTLFQPMLTLPTDQLPPHFYLNDQKPIQHKQQLDVHRNGKLFDEYLREEVVNRIWQRSGLNQSPSSLSARQRYQLLYRTNEFLTVAARQQKNPLDVGQYHVDECEQLGMMRRKVQLWLPGRQTRHLLYNKYMGKQIVLPQQRSLRTNYIYRVEGRQISRNRQEKQFGNMEELDGWRLRNRHFYCRYPSAEQLDFGDIHYPTNYALLPDLDCDESNNNQSNLTNHLNVTLNRVVCYKQFVKSSSPFAIVHSVEKYQLLRLPLTPQKEFVVFQREDKVIENEADIQQIYPRFIREQRQKYSKDNDQLYIISESESQTAEISK